MKWHLPQIEIGQAEDRAILQTSTLDHRRGTALHDDRDTHNLSAGFAKCFDRGHNAAASGRGVLHREHSAADNIGALDAPLQTVGLAFFAHHKGIKATTLSCCGVQHRCSNRVGSERKSAYCVEVQIGDQVQHASTHEWRRLRVQSDAPQVDVVVGFSPTTEDDFSVYDGFVEDLLA